MKITLTGLDEKTDLSRLAHLKDVEFGILWRVVSGKRYPRVEWIREAVKVLDHTSIHVCGNQAIELVTALDQDFLHVADRIQLNGKLEPTTVYKVLSKYKKPVITQYCKENMSLMRLILDFKHQLLVDASGGKGILPSYWPSLLTFKAVGFAGGLNWQNLHIQLPLIRAVERKDCWIDMESSLRINDKFSIDLALETVSVFNELKNCKQ